MFPGALKMTLIEKIDADLKAAMIAKDEARLSTIRFLKSALKYVLIEKKQAAATDADVLQMIQKQVKQHRESFEQFKQNNRADLADKEANEIRILESYLPKQMSDGDLQALIQKIVADSGASSKKDFGRVMKLAQEKCAGGADSKRISEILGKLLT